jgi:H2-forming N5,N10-methylenetetrahydromethanopterin dehydrogenase-like enzyme
MVASSMGKMHPDTLNGFMKKDRVVLVQTERDKIVLATDRVGEREIEAIRKKFSDMFWCDVDVVDIAAHPGKHQELMQVAGPKEVSS